MEKDTLLSPNNMRILLQNISAEAKAELDLQGVNFDALTASQLAALKKLCEIQIATLRGA